MDLKTLPCKRSDCRFEQLPNTTTALPVTPAVLDREGKVVTEAVNPNTTTYYAYCAACDRTWSQEETNGAKGEWSSVEGKQHPTIAAPQS